MITSPEGGHQETTSPEGPKSYLLLPRNPNHTIFSEIKSHNLFRNKFTQPLTSPEFPESDQASPEGQNQTISTSPEEHNQTISTSPEYQNQTIFTSPEVTKPNFWLKGIITPDPPSQEPKLICISPGRGLMLSRGKGVWGARPVAG